MGTKNNPSNKGEKQRIKKVNGKNVIAVRAVVSSARKNKSDLQAGIIACYENFENAVDHNGYILIYKKVD